jgi:hypothetical protein
MLACALDDVTMFEQCRTANCDQYLASFDDRISELHKWRFRRAFDHHVRELRKLVDGHDRHWFAKSLQAMLGSTGAACANAAKSQIVDAGIDCTRNRAADRSESGNSNVVTAATSSLSLPAR